MTPKDWTHIAIASADNSPLTPVQLQKSLFLIGRNIGSDRLQVSKFYEFVPYDYGPFCSVIYSDAEQLEAEGKVSVVRPSHLRYKLFSVTETGKASAANLLGSLDDVTRTYVRAVVSFTQSMSFKDLVSTIYSHYPEMKANSVFKE